MIKIEYRIATERDTDIIYNLEREIFGIDGYNRGIVEYLIMLSDFFIVACIENKIVGYICGEVRGDYGHIITLAVKREYRRIGIGTELVNKFIDFLKHRNIKKIYLEVSEKNNIAIKFYLKNGFYIKGKIKRYYKNGSDALIMERVFQPET